MFSGFAHLTAKPKIHRGRSEKKRGERRIPGAIENVAGYDEKIFAGLPRTNAPVSSNNNYEENDESERIEKHAEVAIESHCREHHRFG